jgi:hypothetical protein
VLTVSVSNEENGACLSLLRRESTGLEYRKW